MVGVGHGADSHRGGDSDYPQTTRRRADQVICLRIQSEAIQKSAIKCMNLGLYVAPLLKSTRWTWCDEIRCNVFVTLIPTKALLEGTAQSTTLFTRESNGY